MIVQCGLCRRAGSPIPVYGDGRPSNNSLLVKPDCSWRDILLSEEAVSWLIPLLEGLRRQPESHLAAASRQLLVSRNSCCKKALC